MPRRWLRRAAQVHWPGALRRGAGVWWRWRCWFPGRAAGGILAGRRGCRRTVRRAGNFVAYARTPALLLSALEQPVGRLRGHACHGAHWPSASPTRSRAQCMPGAWRAASRWSAAGAVAAVGHLADLLVRQPGVLKDWLARRASTRSTAPGIVMAEIFRRFPHALMILVTALTRRRDARLYEAADAMGTGAAQVLHHHAARRQVRPDLGRAGDRSRW